MERYSFAGKHVLLTGASGGIGSALSGCLAEAGARMVLSSRSDQALAELISMLGKPAETGTAIPIQADLSRPGEAERLAREALSALGHIDVLFNVAGVGYFALMEESSPENVRYLFEVNSFSPLALIKTLIPHMRERGSGRIINIVSSAARVPIPTMGVYGGSKSALAIMANTMRLELSPLGIDIINIYPGTANTAFEDNALRENQRPGICPRESCGRPRMDVAKKVFEAARGAPGEVWLEPEGKWMATAAIIWPGHVDRKLRPLRDRSIGPSPSHKPPEMRRWRLFQVESAIACNLKCIMCPWTGTRQEERQNGVMAEEVWRAVVPHLPEVGSVDFSGGGEALLNPHLAEWIAEAKAEGCETGFLTNGMLLSEEEAGRLLEAGVDWIGFSVDGATAPVYEEIRIGANFAQVCGNISTLAKRRIGRFPSILMNFVMMEKNFHQLEDIVRLAARLGVDQVNFKQCDVVRGEHGRGFGLFADKESRRVRPMQKALSRARRIARKLKVNTTAFSFTPEELPVCDQDPRNSVFIRVDGSVAPCINLAIGGAAMFFGREVTMPTVHYGRLPEKGLEDLWDSEKCRFYRDIFNKRAEAHDSKLAEMDFEPSLPKLKDALQAAIDAMPEAPEGCRVCHYLYDI